jgi:radical SAM superfamily enzyme YgiQ (UPF0313 family)
LIVGLPTEEQADIEYTKEFLQKYKPDSVTLCTFIPFPGCEIAKNPVKYQYKVDISAPYSKYVICGKESLVSPIGTKEFNNKILDYRQQLLDTIAEVSVTTNSVLKKRRHSVEKI